MKQKRKTNYIKIFFQNFSQAKKNNEKETTTTQAIQIATQRILKENNKTIIVRILH